MRTTPVALVLATATALLPAQDPQASFVRFGTGCPRGQTAYEPFSAANPFDLGFESICFVPNGGNYYIVRGPGFDPSYANVVVLGDDSNQGFAFPAPGFPFAGQTFAQGAMVSNGFAWLGNAPGTNPNAPFVGAAALVAGSPRVAPFWCNLDPSTGGQCYLDIVPGFFWRVMLTWVNVPVSGSPTSTATCQAIFESNGIITLNWLLCATGASGAITGVSIGGGTPDPGPVDLSVRPFWMGGPSTVPPLSLAALAGSRPVLGTTFQLQVGDIPVGTAAGALVLGLQSPWLDLGWLTMHGCTQYASVEDQIWFVPGGNVHILGIAIPANPVFTGVSVQSQAVTFSPGHTQLGVITSNGGRIYIGN